MAIGSKNTRITPDFYLASTEGYDMGEPRRCWRLRRIISPSRDDLLLIRIDPPLLAEKCGLCGQDIDVVLVATRHRGASLFPINDWPVYVHVACPMVDNPELRDELKEHEFKSIAWAELYQSEEDARVGRQCDRSRWA
jgi:hypothetical protein